MCGIAGFVGSKDTRGLPDLSPTLAALGHRGPDAHAARSLGPAVLGHTRLSIVDVEHGAQPMANERRTVWTTFNGEIWNYQSLRAQLASRGHLFSTNCDTEVLVHGWEEWGEDLPSRLDGMFAFAVWDLRAETLFLARDRLGKKPLYYAPLENGLSFGSDCRSALLAGGLAPRFEVDALPHLLFHRYVAGSLTPFEGVRRLAPGRRLTYRAGDLRMDSYWSPAASDVPVPVETMDLRASLRDAVRKRLMGDVPVGLFLSGGVDSAIILGLMSEVEPGIRAPTFTVGIPDQTYDERPAARLVARKYGSSHHEVVLSAQDYVDALPRLAWLRDEPIAEPSEVPLFLLAEFAASQSLKVALSGDGGDELFGGYPKYRAERVLQLPTAVPAHALSVAAYLEQRRKSTRLLRRARETLLLRDKHVRWASWFRSFSEVEARDLVTPKFRPVVGSTRIDAQLTEALSSFRLLDDGRQILLGDLLTYLPENMLLRSDRVLMGASIEGRMPLLDTEVVRKVVNAPARARVSLRQTKALLHKAAGDLVPPEVRQLPKRGFKVPVTDLLQHDGRNVLDAVLLSDRCLDRGIFEPSAVRQLLLESRSPRLQDDNRLFTLLSIELWLRANVDRIDVAPPTWDQLLS